MIVLVSLVIVLLDQLTKGLVRHNMQTGESIPLLNNFLHLTYVQNAGAGFGILQGQQVLFIVLSVIVLGGIAYYYKRIPDIVSYNVVTAMLIGGTIGNLVDRIFLGYVVDFLDFRIWPVFNVADSCLTIAIVIMIIMSFKMNKK